MKNKLIVSIAFVVGVGIGISGALLLNGNPSSADSCSGVKGHSYSVMIMDSKVQPAGTINGMVCDTITFTNMDDIAREVAFGPHEEHIPYDGVAEKVLNKDQSFTITLNEIGNYHWHDHLHDEVEGFFNVTK